MKTVIFITNNYHPYAGGVVRSIDSFVQELRKEGYQVYIVTLDFTALRGSTLLPTSLKLRRTGRMNGAKSEAGRGESDPWVIRLRCFVRFQYKNNPMAIPWRPYAQLKKIIQELKPDIIHVQHPFFLGYKAAIIARRMKIPCVFTYHTLYEAYAHYAPLIPRSWIRTASISFCNKVDHVIAPSTPIYDYHIKYGVKTPVTVIPNPLREDYLYAVQPQKMPHARFRLLSVGRLVKEKNLYTLLDVVAQLPREAYLLTLIGYGHEEENLKRYAYEHHGFTQDEVQFIHKPSQEAVRQAYKDADLFLFTSYTDTQGIVLAEAMASGTPVVALDGPGQRDSIEQGTNGFIVENPVAMAQTIERIRLDQRLQEALQKGAFNTAQRYTPQQSVSRLIEVYRRVLEN